MLQNLLERLTPNEKFHWALVSRMFIQCQKSLKYENEYTHIKYLSNQSLTVTETLP